MAPSSVTRAGLVQRARIVLLAADGVAHAAIARRFSISRQTVINWRSRYECGGIDGLFDEDRSGRPRVLDRDEAITATLASPSKKCDVTHWSSRLLADHTDPELVAKVTDIVGLYLNPPENAVVLCVDEKSQIQALDRTDPALPIRIGRTSGPRLRTQRHHHAVRGARHRDRGGHRDLPSPTPSPGVSGVPRACVPRLPGSGIASGDGQLRHPQEAGIPRLARRERLGVFAACVSFRWLPLPKPHAGANRLRFGFLSGSSFRLHCVAEDRE